MKVTPKQYALSLYESLDGKSAAKVKIVIKNFVVLLAKHGRLGEEEKIIKEFAKLWNDQQGIVEAEVASSRGLNKELIRLLKSYVANLSGAKEVVINEAVDKSLLGGVIIRYGDRVLDGSLKNSLLELKDKLIK